MRADRLVSILLLLQTHDRLSARDLAARLEVSERTIQGVFGAGHGTSMSQRLPILLG